MRDGVSSCPSREGDSDGEQNVDGSLLPFGPVQRSSRGPSKFPIPPPVVQPFRYPCHSCGDEKEHRSVSDDEAPAFLGSVDRDEVGSPEAQDEDRRDHREDLPNISVDGVAGVLDPGAIAEELDLDEREQSGGSPVSHEHGCGADDDGHERPVPPELDKAARGSTKRGFGVHFVKSPPLF